MAKAPSGLIRQDCSPKPAYEELRKLVREEWWTKESTFITDQNGHIEFTGFLGEYEISLGDKKASFALSDKDSKEISIYL